MICARFILVTLGTLMMTFPMTLSAQAPIPSRDSPPYCPEGWRYSNSWCYNDSAKDRKQADDVARVIEENEKTIERSKARVANETDAISDKAAEAFAGAFLVLMIEAMVEAGANEAKAINDSPCSGAEQKLEELMDVPDDDTGEMLRAMGTILAMIKDADGVAYQKVMQTIQKGNFDKASLAIENMSLDDETCDGNVRSLIAKFASELSNNL